MTNEEDILKELKKISKIITISNGQSLEKELSKYATTDERKKIWVLIDGTRTSEQIAKEIGITKRAVDIALQHFENAELIEKRKYGVPPQRVVEYMPPSWIELSQKSSRRVETSPELTGQAVKQSSQEASPNG